MSSNKESNTMETDHVDLSDASFEVDDELIDKGDGVSCGEKRQRKNGSAVHQHFVEVDGLFKGKTVSGSTISTSSNEPSTQGDDFFAFLKSRPIETGQKSELEVYLDEPNYAYVGSDFDVLKWWSQHCSKFPVLSNMAKDIFGVPITTVASESAFSAGGRILDDYRSSLTKDMVELLVCGGDWLKAVSKATIKTLEQSAKEEEKLDFDVLIPDGCGT